MTGSRTFRLLPSLLLLVAIASAQSPRKSTPDFTITPAIVEAGSPELITLSARDITSIEGDWFGHKLEFFHRDGKWIALAGVDVEAKPEATSLHITAQTPTGPRDFTRTVEIHPAHYRTGKLTVAPKFVEPDPEQQKEITADSEIKTKIFAASAPQPLWQGSFHAPVKLPPTDSFGTRRMFNGKLASIHKGMDFRAPSGTVVRASNSGVVVLARPLYFEGNCVVIDHGLGLYTLFMHFSRIDVHEGQHVDAGDKLGLSGATGRVTGPHLHWAVRWQNAYLDPAKLLHLNLNTIR
ncbi:M23 family metallopeptidase [Occallatibacter savannae]|uniref:M23 family metallopeptidase n=1 Tax=Occallatibacter savannae TaxID=1002691 RepID=UPI000D68E1BE|nr:M23 family metallopeptidase [Occallatibacter savannae]